MATKYIFRKISKNTGDDAVKLAPQEQVLFDLIPATKGGIERAALIEALDAAVEAETLKTKQKTSIILGYYKKHLVDSGLVEVEKVVEEKPAKKAA
jgi:hypothetical protein